MDQEPDVEERHGAYVYKCYRTISLWTFCKDEGGDLVAPLEPSSFWKQKAPITGAFVKRMMGLELTTFCMASRRSTN